MSAKKQPGTTGLKPRAYCVVTDQDGTQGLIDVSQLEEQQAEITVNLPGSQKAQVAFSALHLRETGTYFFPDSLTSMTETSPLQTTSATSEDYVLAIPVIVEEAHIRKEWHETGRVRVTKVAHETEEQVHELLRQEQVTVERVAIDQLVETMPIARQEAETFIIPLVEEELVVVKRLRLKEEIRITKQVTEKPITEAVTLRQEDVVVERIEGQTKDQ